MTAYNPKHAILEAIHDSGGAWTGVKNAGRLSHHLFWLVENNYLSAWGKDWDSAVIMLTDKSREYLKALQIEVIE